MYLGKFVGCRSDPWKHGEFLTIIPQTFGPTYAGAKILQTPIAGTIYIIQDHSCITTLNRAALLYRKTTSTGTFCDNCSAEDNDKKKKNVIIETTSIFKTSQLPLGTTMAKNGSTVLRHILFWHYLDYHFSTIWIDGIRFTDSQALEDSTYSMI